MCGALHHSCWQGAWMFTEFLTKLMTQVFPNDHGRCHALAGMSQEDQGEMFAVQPTGDLALTDFETRSWFCYRPRRDVLLPSPMETQVCLFIRFHDLLFMHTMKGLLATVGVDCQMTRLWGGMLDSRLSRTIDRMASHAERP